MSNRMPLDQISANTIKDLNDAYQEWVKHAYPEGTSDDVGPCGDTGDWTVEEIQAMTQQYRRIAEYDRVARDRNATGDWEGEIGVES